ncbi:MULTISPECIES: flagellar export protein FliJ [unclassified Sporolactobacillus]|uniref:flagellar export protein FliJ n=1 Tax=unclassified Sporolactobacillus TaxID=2628533 RepID=UPI00236850A3|nr:flagellar export protein FliJ [Sporolactobacillus sp. CQH2019]MDD9147063.1 flagellar export protein FliJ [Sporolactobacillus sp. CQH2019]
MHDFRFERVMKIAESEKKTLEVQYRLLFDHFEQLAHGLLDLIEEKKSIQKNLQDKMKQSITIDLVKSQIYDVEKTERLIDEQTVQYERAKNQLEQFKAVLLRKAIEVKKYEKIKQKQMFMNHSDARKKETKMLDEVAALHSANNG